MCDELKWHCNMLVVVVCLFLFSFFGCFLCFWAVFFFLAVFFLFLFFPLSHYSTENLQRAKAIIYLCVCLIHRCGWPH